MCVQQYGLGSLNQDADDILALARHLREEYACNEWILAGHSTGTQDAVRYAARHGLRADGTPPLKAAILLAPVRLHPSLLRSTAWRLPRNWLPMIGFRTTGIA